MTESELTNEHEYLVTERLGIMCGEASPTPEQLEIALEEADAAIEVLRTSEQTQSK